MSTLRSKKWTSFSRKARERTQIADAQLQVRLWFCQYREDHRIKDAVAATLRPHFTLAMRSLLPIFRSKPRTFWIDKKPIKEKERIQRNDTRLRTHIAGLERVDKSPHNFLLMCHVLHLSRPAENPSPKTHKQKKKKPPISKRLPSFLPSFFHFVKKQ
jgi:hypothetical protein